MGVTQEGREGTLDPKFYWYPKFYIQDLSFLGSKTLGTLGTNIVLAALLMEIIVHIYPNIAIILIKCDSCVFMTAKKGIFYGCLSPNPEYSFLKWF